jgi:hypothetical protein
MLALSEHADARGELVFRQTSVMGWIAAGARAAGAVARQSQSPPGRLRAPPQSSGPMPWPVPMEAAWSRLWFAGEPRERVATKSACC